MAQTPKTATAAKPQEDAAQDSENPGQSLTVDDELRRAKNEYAYGNYEAAKKRLLGLLYPMRVYSDAQVKEARLYLGLAYYLLDERNQTEEEFAKLLYLAPDYQLDPFTIAPPIIELFEKVRTKHQKQLDVIRDRKVKEAKDKGPAPGLQREIKVIRTERSEFMSYMPFGLGQFQNEDYGWGAFFAVTEVLLLAANIGSYVWVSTRKVGGLHQYRPSDEGTVQNLLLVQYASAALLVATWSIGVFHARLHFVPVSERTTIRDVESKQSSPGGSTSEGSTLPNIGLGLTFEF